jgi:hypothetical protein
MSMLVLNDVHCGVECPQHHQQQDMNTSDSDFLATHPPVFSGAMDPFEVDDWLHTTKSKFDLLHYIEYQKTLFAA